MNTAEHTTRKLRTPRIAVIRNRELFAWCVYDFGAAAFVTSVLTVFFGPFITTVAHNAAAGEAYFPVFGIAVAPGAYYPYLISLSVLLQILLLPPLGALADRTGKRKALLIVAAAFGTGCLLAMLFIGDADALTGGGLFILANIAFGASDVLYNAFLPDICPASERNSVSSIGWGFGYFGAGILLIIQYLFLGRIESFGISDLHAARLALVSCGVWWGAFAAWSLKQLRNTQNIARPAGTASKAASTVQQLRNTIRDLRRYPQTLMFLIAFLLYSDGIQTVTTVSTQFGQEEIGLRMEQLAEVILIVQFVGVLGAVLFNMLSKWIGTKRAILTALMLYIVIMFYSYALLTTAFEFYIMAACLALVLVGSQALSRAAFSRMIPMGKEAQYFGIYEISERGTSWLGPLFFGLALQFTGSYRTAILSLVLYFIIGAALLLRVKFEQAEADVRIGERLSPPPADIPPQPGEDSVKMNVNINEEVP